MKLRLDSQLCWQLGLQNCIKCIGEVKVCSHDEKNKGGNGGKIATIVVVGIILAVIIGVVVHKKRKKDY